MTHSEPIHDLQTAIDGAPVRGQVAMVPAGCYSGDAIVPSDRVVLFCGPIHISGSLTIPKGCTVEMTHITMRVSKPGAAMHYKPDGTVILNARFT